MRIPSVARTAALAAVISGAVVGIANAQVTTTPPGTPSTGLGGDAAAILATLAISGVVAVVGLRYALRNASR